MLSSPRTALPSFAIDNYSETVENVSGMELHSNGLIVLAGLALAGGGVGVGGCC